MSKLRWFSNSEDLQNKTKSPSSYENICEWHTGHTISNFAEMWRVDEAKQTEPGAKMCGVGFTAEVSGWVTRPVLAHGATLYVNTRENSNNVVGPH